MRRPSILLPFLLLLLALAPAPAPADDHARDPADPADFYTRLRDALLLHDGFRIRFEATGPGGFSGSGELSFRRPVKARIDLDGQAAPLAWVKNGENVFLRIGADRIFPLPAAAAATCRLGAFPGTPAALDAACLALLHAPETTLRSDFQGHELSGRLPGGGEFRLECDREFVPRAFASTAPGGDAWRVRFTDFRAEAPEPALFEPRARFVSDLYR